MLEKNFDGRQLWIKTHSDNILIDAMFFPASCERVILKSEKDQEKSKP